MEKSEIRKRATEIESKEDLLLLLNDIVKDELGKDDAFSFSMQQLNYYSNPNNVRGRYHHFSIPKKSGGKRNIAAPSKGLGHILYYVNILLKSIYQPSDFAMGFVEGRCVVDNAMRHIGQNYVFNTDLENFFPSIEQPRVWKRFQLKPFNFKQPIANLLAGLCCIKEKHDDGTFKYVVPQGAPTSPLITNAICDTLDRRLNGLARRFNLHYSRYADDITFSSMRNVFKAGGDFRMELKRIIEGQNFKMNEAKTRLQKKGERQEVTGLTVSNKVNTSSAYVAEIRNILHIWEKFGYNDAYKRFYPKYKESKGHVKKGEPLLENVLYGKLQYLKMVKGVKDPVYVALQARYDKLTSPVNAEVKQKYDYLRSFTLAEFEEIVECQISYALSKEDNLYGKVILNGKDIIISISNEAKTQLVKNKIVTDEALVASVKPIKNVISVNSKPGLYVVLTAKNGKAPFWMMTYYDPTVTDIDLSQVSVAELVNIWEKNGIDAAIKAYEDGILLTSEDASMANKNSKDKKNTPMQKRKSASSKDESVYMGDIDFIDVADIAAIEEEIKSGNLGEVKLSFSKNDEADNSGNDELDTIIDEGSFDDL
ncbi:MAG: RNA-directed DNA polymerase [Prevotella sp.]|nr:RNA-directed DNA polymerase [Prevotella sp.]